MDKLADSLQKLNEDDLLQVVQMVHDHKAPDSYTKNDVEREYSPVRIPSATLTLFPSWRVPRGSVHLAGLVDQDALGVCPRPWSILSGRVRSQ